MYLSPKEYAERFRVSPRTVQRMCQEGRLDHIRVGRCIRIPEDARITEPSVEPKPYRPRSHGRLLSAIARGLGQ